MSFRRLKLTCFATRIRKIDVINELMAILNVKPMHSKTIGVKKRYIYENSYETKYLDFL